MSVARRLAKLGFHPSAILLMCGDPQDWVFAPEHMNYSEAEAWAAGRATIGLSSGHTLVRNSARLGNKTLTNSLTAVSDSSRPVL